jgi:hypothetical protein
MEKKFIFASLPCSLDDLKALPEASLADPYATAALFVVAIARYPQDRDSALQMIGFLKGAPLNAYKQRFVADRMAGKDYLPHSYMLGATPANGYSPSQPFTVVVSDNPYSKIDANNLKLFLKSSGADSPRPVMLTKADGKWVMSDEMLLADIRKPQA